MDAGSGRVLQGRYLAPAPVAWRNKRRVLRKATIFLPGAGIVKGAAIAPLTRSRVMKRQRNAGHKVNGIILWDTMFSLQNNSAHWMAIFFALPSTIKVSGNADISRLFVSPKGDI